jgi:hypothetical protein
MTISLIFCLQLAIIQAARVFVHALVVGAVAFATPLSLSNNLNGEGGVVTQHYEK